MSDASLLQNLGTIGERSNEIAVSYNEMILMERTVSFADVGAIGPNASKAKPRASPAIIHLAAGPSTPRAVDRLCIHPPRLADVSSDDGSGDERTPSRPLSLGKIKRRNAFKNHTKPDEQQRSRNAEKERGEGVTFRIEDGGNGM